MNPAAMASWVHSHEPDIAEQLGTDIEDAREFALVALYAIECNPKLYEVSRESLLASILTAAKMRLVPGLGLGRLGYQIGDSGRPEALFSPSWRGLLQLLQDHAGVVDATCEVFYERDRLVHKRGSNGVSDVLEFEPCSWGPRGALQGVFVRFVLESRSLQPISHTEVLWRQGDIDPIAPDGSDQPDSARGKSLHDYVEFCKTVAFKRAAKWCASRQHRGASLIAAAIELERGSERSRVVPSAEKVARMLGINVEPRRSVEELDQAAKEIDEEQLSVKELEAFAGNDFQARLATCCECLKAKEVRGYPEVALSKECPGRCVYFGGNHKLCGSCFKKLLTRMRKVALKKTPPGVAASPAAAVVVVSPTPPVSGAGINAPAPQTSSNGKDSSGASAPESRAFANEIQSDSKAVLSKGEELKGSSELDSKAAVAIPYAFNGVNVAAVNTREPFVDPEPTPAFGSPMPREGYPW